MYSCNPLSVSGVSLFRGGFRWDVRRGNRELHGKFNWERRKLRFLFSRVTWSRKTMAYLIRRRSSARKNKRISMNIFFLGDYGMYSGCIDQRYSLFVVQWATVERSFGNGTDVNSRTYSGTHVQVSVVPNSDLSISDLWILSFQGSPFKFSWISSLDRCLDIYSTDYLCDIQPQFPGEVHHTIHRRLLCFLSRHYLHLWCCTRNPENSPNLSS